MGDGMGSGDWTAAAEQIMASDPPGTEIVMSDTVNNSHGDHVDGYQAVKRDDGSVKVTKQHSP
jgi:hypothetical protein